ncbi:MAG: lipopolysaccharide heptosyltransferase I [Burkholderiaceae bacterium]
MRLALVKTSSMGDVIHALPVVSDIRQALPGAEIDWIVEEGFADLPRLHPGVRRVLPVAIRRWRKSWLAADTRAQIRQAKAAIAAQPYDLVLDLQGLLKSAWIASWARGVRVGFSRRCAREPLAALTYARRYDVDMHAHAIERLRQLAGQACGYPVSGLPRFDLAPPGPRVAAAPAGRYVVLLHATSRVDKQWPLADWQALAGRLGDRGLAVALPWGSDEERAQAERIAASAPGAVVLPRLSLADCACLLRDAQAVVGVDTGLTHLAAALDRPTVALFAATPAWRFGPYWTPRAVSLGEPGQWPSVAQVLDGLDEVGRA